MSRLQQGRERDLGSQAVVVKFLDDGEWIRVLQGPGLGCSWVGSGLGHCLLVCCDPSAVRVGDIPGTGLRPSPLLSELPVW